MLKHITSSFVRPANHQAHFDGLRVMACFAIVMGHVRVAPAEFRVFTCGRAQNLVTHAFGFPFVKYFTMLKSSFVLDNLVRMPIGALILSSCG